jgi:hypothetical protein
MSAQETNLLSSKAASFARCEACAYDFRTDEGARACHYYECPYLPEELNVWCPTCRYNFLVRDGNSACGDSPRCDFARDVAPGRVRAMEQWLALQP